MANQLHTTECHREWLTLDESKRFAVRIIPHICVLPKHHPEPCKCICGAIDDE